MGRDEPCSQVSHASHLALCPRLCAAGFKSRLAKSYIFYPTKNGDGRDLRSPSRRIFPLLRRWRMVCSSLRENGLRQRAAARTLRQSLSGQSGLFLLGKSAGNQRLAPSRDDARRRGLSRSPRCGQRRGGREVLYLDCRRAAGTPRAGFWMV